MQNFYKYYYIPRDDIKIHGWYPIKPKYFSTLIFIIILWTAFAFMSFLTMSNKLSSEASQIRVILWFTVFFAITLALIYLNFGNILIKRNMYRLETKPVKLDGKRILRYLQKNLETTIVRCNNNRVSISYENQIYYLLFPDKDTNIVMWYLWKKGGNAINDSDKIFPKLGVAIHDYAGYKYGRR